MVEPGHLDADPVVEGVGLLDLDNPDSCLQVQTTQVQTVQLLQEGS